jgi:copper chaperone NosL
MKISAAFVLVFLFVSFSCSIESEEINYGKESCHFCKMTIVDNQHASEAVSSKGKVFKYDAIECMISDLNKTPEREIALLFVIDYSTPGILIDAKTATFLVSKEIKSPMGAFLSAFEAKIKAQKTMGESGGKLFTWEEIKKEIK